MTELSRLHQLLLKLLTGGSGQTTAHLAEALRAEHPAEFDRIMAIYLEKNKLSACGTFMSPLVVVGGALGELAAAGLVTRKYAGGVTLWVPAEK